MRRITFLEEAKCHIGEIILLRGSINWMLHGEKRDVKHCDCTPALLIWAEPWSEMSDARILGMATPRSGAPTPAETLNYLSANLHLFLEGEMIRIFARDDSVEFLE